MSSSDEDLSPAPHRQVLSDSDEEEHNYGITHHADDDDDESSRMWRSIYCSYNSGRRSVRLCWWSIVTKWSQEWNRIYVLMSTVGLFVDPLFFYVLSISDSCMCLYVDGWFAIAVTILRCMNDVLHLWNIWLQFKMKRKIKKSFLFEIFLILPLPQLLLWVVTPKLMNKGSPYMVMAVFLSVFIVQYLPKIYHSVCLLLQLHSNYVFGSTVWLGFALNMLGYFIASHAAGGCWYLLGIQRVIRCFGEQCSTTNYCRPRLLTSEKPIFYGTTLLKDKARMHWSEYKQARDTCLLNTTDYNYGFYEWSVQLVTNPNRIEKMLFPIFWGLMTLSSFGNLQQTTDILETVFSIIILTGGLILVTMLIGNIKIFLNGKTSKKQAINLKLRNIEWWMKQRNLPTGFRHRVRQYERQRWAAMRGVDEYEIVRNLPQGLRRDIKYHLCLDLVRQVPLFQHMDDLVLQNICDRVKSIIFPKGETITREGDPVQRMIFVLRGHLESRQLLRDGVESRCMLGPGNFTGDELLSWCLRRPFINHLPPSTSTLVTLETTEVFGLEAEDVIYVTRHFRYTFLNEKVRRSARYYSPGWRTWAAVAIQLAWRRYKRRLTLTSLSFLRPRRPMSRSSSREEEKLRLYTAILTSPKPDQDDPANGGH